jgi:tRNA-dihydrouridine synthase A
MLINRLISVAPMMDWTDRHDRYFLRLIAPHVLLYSEMITTGALKHGDVPYLLQYDEKEHPLALQLGGSHPDDLSTSAKLGESWGYDEINLNVGCPSGRVKAGQFGACLMLDPSLVRECVSAMRESVAVPVTVKCRIGVDDKDSYEDLIHFISEVGRSGCNIFIIHARKALLNGLSPKENREIPPLCYDVVYQLKRDFPQFTIILNGGLKTIEQIEIALEYVDGVMIGREAYSNPFFLAEIEKRFFSHEIDRKEVILKLIPYIEKELKNKMKLSHITRHILGLFQGQLGAKKWRRFLSENAHKNGAGIEIIEEALKYV